MTEAQAREVLKTLSDEQVEAVRVVMLAIAEKEDELNDRLAASPRRIYKRGARLRAMPMELLTREERDSFKTIAELQAEQAGG